MPTKDDISDIVSKDILEELWDQQFSTSYELKKIPENTLKYFNNINKRLERGVLLDVGCGSGRNKKFFEDNGWVCYGTDITQEGLKVASKYTPINLIHAPAHDLPFRDNFLI